MTTRSDRTRTDIDRKDGAPVEPPAPYLFAVLRCDDPRSPPSRHALAFVDEVRFGRADTYEAVRAVEAGVARLELRLPDPRMSRAHARLRRVLEGYVLEDLGSSNGTRVGGERCTHAALTDGDFFELGQTLFRLRTALPTPLATQGDLRADALDTAPLAMRTLLPSLAQAHEQLSRVARSLVPVMLLGETGSGKELYAQAIHTLSGRAGAFVALNCGALPATLLESLLFGHVRGAFSGATRDELGYVRSADGGSLFLDEIGDLPAASQTALLRVLQEREVVPVGATRAISVDLRAVSATHAALFELAEQGAFRSDLYARLAGFTFRALPLRERREDLGLVLRSLWPELEAARGVPLRLHPEAAQRLVTHAFARNVRELRQMLLAAAVLADDGVIAVSHLPALTPAAEPRRTDDDVGDDDELKRAELVRLFTLHRGNVTQVAKALGKARVQVQRWMKRFAIDPTDFR